MNTFRSPPPYLAITAALACGIAWWVWPGGSDPSRSHPSATSALRPESPAPRQEQSAPRSTAQDSSSVIEAYLEELEALSTSDKRQAFELVRSADDWFPKKGVHAEAREAMSITLLVDLDRMSEARAQVRTFLERHPNSRYRPLVQGVTGIHPRPSSADYQ